MNDKRRKGYCILLVAFPFICICGYCLFINVFYPRYSEATAMALVPPKYPESILVDDYLGGGSQGVVRLQIYETSDSVQDVIAFMEKYVPAFVYDPRLNEYSSSALPPKGIYYGNGSVKIAISQKQDDPTTTVIQFRIAWASP